MALIAPRYSIVASKTWTELHVLAAPVPLNGPSSGAELGVTLRKGEAVVRRLSTNWPTNILRVVGDRGEPCRLLSVQHRTDSPNVTHK